MILVQLREHGGHFALAVSVVKGVVDGGRRDAQTGSRIAVEDHAHAQPIHLLIGCHVTQLGYFLQTRHHLGNEGIQLGCIRILERVLILRAADAIFHCQILHRLHVKRDSGNLGQRRLQAPDNVARVDLAVLEGLQVNLNAPAVLSVVLVPSTPMNEDRLSTAGSCRITLPSACCRSDMARNEMVCSASDTP